ncbi:MAG: Uncharacterized protein E1N59_303 [Puniceicoccaceae bacterium 5H]|nr:MAG: Uncharacterized protein E1N59_303 [Puniceicoccaceae bacterium 5H]
MNATVMWPRARHYLAPGDAAFLLETLAPDESTRPALEKLLYDPEMLDVIMDTPKLVQTLREKGETIQISTRLFFYILVRDALKTAELKDREVADYLAGMLADAAHQENWLFPFQHRTGPLLYAVDYWREMEKASSSQRFFLSISAGNHYLLLTGFYREFLHQREERQGAPGLEFYESMGQTAYRQARDHRLAREYEMREILDGLIHGFPRTREQFNRLATQWHWRN